MFLAYMYAGESEAGLRGIFAAASALAPAVIFIDEIDALAPSRSGPGGGDGAAASSDMSGRVVTALLTLMDGLGESLARRHLFLLELRHQAC